MMPLENYSNWVGKSAIKVVRRTLPLPLKIAIRRLITATRLQCENLVGRYQCAVCENRVFRFDPLPLDAVTHNFKYSSDQAEMCNAANYSCPRCGAADRERLYAVYLQEYFSAISVKCGRSDSIKFVDFAPSVPLSSFIKRLVASSPCVFSYRTADLFSPGVDDRVDIMDMKVYQDESVDFFLCSHVLEHVPDDKRALSELYRILKPGGQGILVVPIVLAAIEIDEDPSLTDAAERWRRFGQDDHVRLYSKEGFLKRVAEAGFTARQLGFEHFGKKTFALHGITERSILYVVEKLPGS
jgi:SAM-dependent methyltransferase